MKGMIFTEFLDLVEETWGMAMADRIIAESKLASHGAYTAVGNYDPAELIALVTRLSAAVGTPVAELEAAFGKRIFTLFTRSYGHFFRSAPDAFQFLSGIESYIHVEVRKLYPDAELPTFSYPRRDERSLVMDYQSTRPLAHFAYGLIQATVAHYRENVRLTMEDRSGGAGTAARFTLERQ